MAFLGTCYYVPMLLDTMGFSRNMLAGTYVTGHVIRFLPFERGSRSNIIQLERRNDKRVNKSLAVISGLICVDGV